jgi:hypothetical protein
MGSKLSSQAKLAHNAGRILVVANAGNLAVPEEPNLANGELMDFSRQGSIILSEINYPLFTLSSKNGVL